MFPLSKIEFLNGHSSSLIVSDSNHSLSTPSPLHHLPQRVDLVVTELVDSGLVGEHMIKVLRHARQQLLKEDSGIMIPAAACLYAYPIECKELRSRQRMVLDEEAVRLLAPIAPQCEVMLETEPKTPKRRKQFYGLSCDSFIVKVDEQYTCESLSYFPHRKLCEEPMVAIELDFHQLAKQPQDEEHSSDIFVNDFRFQSSSSYGEVDAIAVCFDLVLDRGQSDINKSVSEMSGEEREDAKLPISFSTRPERKNCGWDQGIYPLNGCGLDSLQASSSYKLRTKLKHDDSLAFEIFDENDDGTEHTGEGVSSDVSYEIGEMDMAAMNNREWQCLFVSALISLIRDMQNTEGIGGHHKVRVLELCGSFSLISLLASSSSPPITTATGATTNNIEMNGENVDFYVRNSSTIHGDIINSFKDENNASTCVEVLGCCDSLSSYLYMKGLLPEASLTSDPVSTIPTSIPSESSDRDVVVLDLIEGCGLIRQGALEEVDALLQYAQEHGEPQPVIMPSSLEIVLVPMECDWLEDQNRVTIILIELVRMMSLSVVFVVFYDIFNCTMKR